MIVSNHHTGSTRMITGTLQTDEVNVLLLHFAFNMKIPLLK